MGDDKATALRATEAEVERRTNEVLKAAEAEGKKLSRADARLKVFDADPDFYESVRAEQLAASRRARRDGRRVSAANQDIARDSLMPQRWDYSTLPIFDPVTGLEIRRETDKSKFLVRHFMRGQLGIPVFIPLPVLSPETERDPAFWRRGEREDYSLILVRIGLLPPWVSLEPTPSRAAETTPPTRESARDAVRLIRGEIADRAEKFRQAEAEQGRPIPAHAARDRYLSSTAGILDYERLRRAELAEREASAEGGAE